MSLENICAIDGIANEVPLDALIAKLSNGLYLSDSFGSREEKLSDDSYLAAIRKSKELKNCCSPSIKAAYLFLLSPTFFPPPRKNRSAVLVIFPSSSNSALARSLYLMSRFSLFN